MAAESIDLRMARLEGAYGQINERLGRIESRLDQVALRQDLADLRGEFGGLRGELHEQVRELRSEMRGQFYWLLSLVVVSILVPIFLRLFASPI